MIRSNKIIDVRKINKELEKTNLRISEYTFDSVIFDGLDKQDRIILDNLKNLLGEVESITNKRNFVETVKEYIKICKELYNLK